MLENKDMAKQTKFEKVDIQNFLGDSKLNNIALHSIIAKIADNNPTIILGIESLLTEKIILHSFDRALATLITAKNDRNLQKVEAGFQTTINEVKSYSQQNSPFMTKQKTSLYLYTLQNLIFNLDKWNLPNQEKNNFVPTLKQKLQDVSARCSHLGITDDVIHRECFIADYQQPYHPVLRNFEFLDENRLDSFNKRLRKFELTRNPNDLYDVKVFPTARSTNQKNQAIETIIHRMEKKFKIKELDRNYYREHFNIFNQEIINIIGANDLPTIYEINDAITQYLEAKHQFKIQINSDEKIM